MSERRIILTTTGIDLFTDDCSGADVRHPDVADVQISPSVVWQGYSTRIVPIKTLGTTSNDWGES